MTLIVWKTLPDQDVVEKICNVIALFYNFVLNNASVLKKFLSVKCSEFFKKEHESIHVHSRCSFPFLKCFKICEIMLYLDFVLRKDLENSRLKIELVCEPPIENVKTWFTTHVVHDFKSSDERVIYQVLNVNYEHIITMLNDEVLNTLERRALYELSSSKKIEQVEEDVCREVINFLRLFKNVYSNVSTFSNVRLLHVDEVYPPDYGVGKVVELAWLEKSTSLKYMTAFKVFKDVAEVLTTIPKELEITILPKNNIEELTTVKIIHFLTSSKPLGVDVVVIVKQPFNSKYDKFTHDEFNKVIDKIYNTAVKLYLATEILNKMIDK